MGGVGFWFSDCADVVDGYIGYKGSVWSRGREVKVGLEPGFKAFVKRRLVTTVVA